MRDVLHHYPRRYEDRRALPGARYLEEGQKATLAVKVLAKELVKTPRKGMQLVQVKAQDAWGWRITLVWFNQPWVLSQIEEGATLIVTGRVGRRNGLQLYVEHFEDEGTESLSTGRIVPIYPAKEGVSQAFLRRTVHRALELALPLPDPLEAYREDLGLMPYAEALKAIHFPEDEEALKRALLRLKFDEYLLLELKALLEAGGMVLGRSFRVEEAWVEAFKRPSPSPSPGPRNGSWGRSPRTCKAPARWPASSRGTWARGRRWWRPSPSSSRPRTGPRGPSWPPRRSWPGSTTRTSPATSSPWGSGWSSSWAP